MYHSSSSSDNLINFKDASFLSEDKVAKELEKRFWKGKFYTWVGFSLLAVNPGKFISELYTAELRTFYDEIWKKNKLNEIPPHIYAVASRAKYQMLQDIGKVNQAIVLTGESGSGKTHSANHLLQFFVGCKNESFLRSTSPLCKWANVLLKAFGNAQTVCNCDSSRFGKFMLLHWSNETHSGPQLLGAHLNAYLLEKTRVTDFPDGWNFHIFHQIISGLRENDALALYFPPVRKFRIVPEFNFHLHERSYEETIEAAEKLGISKSEWRSVLGILAAILHLGNVDFQNESEDICNIKSNQESSEGMRRGCHLLGVEEGLLTQLFTTKLIVANGWCSERRGMMENEGGKGDMRAIQDEERQDLEQRQNHMPATRRPSIYRKQCSFPSECHARRDGILRHLYQRLFEWILKRINSKLSLGYGADHHSFKHTIGLLDIFGFEVFENNGLEQLCINYTNERLQRFYIQCNLVKSQEMLEEEGLIPPGTKYDLDNITRESLFDSPTSIFSILNDECKMTWKSDEKDVQKKLGCLKLPHLTFSPIEETDFTVHHYAGNVTYCITGMVAKNSDKVPDELVEFLALSNNDFLKDLLHQERKGKYVAKATHLTKFVESLNDLMRKLGDMDVHFVHCLKPHPIVKPDVIDSAYFLQQLKYAGVMESIDLHQKTFPIRMKFDEFLQRYQILTDANQQNHVDTLLPPRNASPKSSDKGEQCSDEGELTEEKKQKLKCEEIIKFIFEDKETNLKWGRSSLFLSESNVVYLELRKESIYNQAASIIQRHWRKFKSHSVPNKNTVTFSSPLSILVGSFVPTSKKISGATFEYSTCNLQQYRWNGYGKQYMSNSLAKLEETNHLGHGKCDGGLIYDCQEPKNEKRHDFLWEKCMKIYSPKRLVHPCTVAKDHQTEWSSCQDKYLANNSSNKRSILHKSILRLIHYGSGIISRQNIPKVPVRFHTQHTCIPFSYRLPVTLLPQGIPDAFPCKYPILII